MISVRYAGISEAGFGVGATERTEDGGVVIGVDWLFMVVAASIEDAGEEVRVIGWSAHSACSPLDLTVVVGVAVTLSAALTNESFDAVETVR